MRKTKTILLLILALLLAGCGAEPLEATQPLPTEAPPVVAAYEMDVLPQIWDHTAEQTPEVVFLQELTGGRLYERTADGSAVTPELAAALPVDVTAEYAGSYHIPADSARGYAFQIDLNPLACWDDSAAITADDWMTALSEDLSAFAVSETTAETVLSLADAGYGSVAEAEEAGITEFYLDLANFWGLDDGWRKVSDQTRIRDDAMPDGLYETFVSAAYLYQTYLRDGAGYDWMQTEFVGVCIEEVDRSVGLLKTGDYQITLILREPTTVEALALKLEDEQLITGAGRSCGPWRAVSVSSQLIELEPNPNWWGETAAEADILKIRAS